MDNINYIDDIINDISDNGLTQELRDILYDDIEYLQNLGVKNNKERNLAFYLDNFCDDICEEFGVKNFNKNNVIDISFNLLKDKDNIDLTDIRSAIYSSLKKLNKKAYPNIMGVNEQNVKPQRDIEIWVETLAKINNAVINGESKKDAVERFTEDWGTMEKLDFSSWMKYYENDNHRKYNIKVAQELDEIEEVEKIISKPRRKTPEDVKRSLIGRLNAAEKLLYQFANVWPNSVFNRLHQGLSDLKREIMMMNSASSMSDRIYRMASLWERDGFLEGADTLRKIAQPPSGDVASEIERALSGRELKETGKQDIGLPISSPEEGEGELPLPPGEMPMDEDLSGPPTGVEEELPVPEEPPKEEKAEEEKLEEKEEESNLDGNPYDGKDINVQNVLDVLEPLARRLSERDFVRNLLKADMMLDSMNISSHFPELGEAQSKALELMIYVGARVDKVINKLKGGVKEDKEEEGPPNIEMEELNIKEEEPLKEKEPLKEEFPKEEIQEKGEESSKKPQTEEELFEVIE